MINDDFDHQLKAQFDARRRADFADQQHEMAGREVGRIARFLSADARDAKQPSSRDARRREQMSRLHYLLLTSARYRTLYAATWERLEVLETATDAALDEARLTLQQAEKRLDDLQAKANRLPDGRRIYRDKDGRIRDEDGAIIAGSDLDSVVWRGDAPSYEDYQAATGRVAAAKHAVQDLERYQVGTLGRARDRLEDENDPPSEDELRDLAREMEERMPSPVADALALRGDLASATVPAISASKPPQI